MAGDNPPHFLMGLAIGRVATFVSVTAQSNGARVALSCPHLRGNLVTTFV
jgi:hypothetical protein